MSKIKELKKLTEQASDNNNLVSTFTKIKDWDSKALAGYARKVGVPDEVVDSIVKDKDILLDEILGHLFGEDYEKELISLNLI